MKPRLEKDLEYAMVLAALEKETTLNRYQILSIVKRCGMNMDFDTFYRLIRYVKKDGYIEGEFVTNAKFTLTERGRQRLKFLRVWIQAAIGIHTY